jgi:hypothetical protein
MAQGARVESIDALKGLKTALWKFAEAADVALGDAEAELQRVLAWLEVEQTTYWQGQIRKRHEATEKAKEALRMKRLYKDSAGKPQSAAEEEKQLRLAQQRLEEAEQKNALVRRSIPKLQKEIQAYKGGVQQLATTVQMELPAAAGRLEGMIAKLEEYVGLAPPTAAASASASESQAPSMGRGQSEAMEPAAAPAPAPASARPGFPDLAEPQVAVGEVEGGGPAGGEGEENGVKYRVFDSLQQAQAYAIEAVKQSPARRCVIYDHAGRELLVVGP